VTPRRLKELAERAADETVVLSPAEREIIADYLLHSCPIKTVDELTVVIDKIIRGCEAKGWLKELCMNARCRIATLTLKWKTLAYRSLEEVINDQEGLPEILTHEFDPVHPIPIGVSGGDSTLNEAS
jgi:hypothetical protein